MKVLIYPRILHVNETTIPGRLTFIVCSFSLCKKVGKVNIVCKVEGYECHGVQCGGPRDSIGPSTTEHASNSRQAGSGQSDRWPSRARRARWSRGRQIGCGTCLQSQHRRAQLIQLNIINFIRSIGATGVSSSFL